MTLRKNTQVTVDNNSAKGPLRILFYLLGHLKYEYLGLVAMSAILSGVEGVLHPLLIKSIFDLGVIQSNFHRFAVLAFAYVCLGFLINAMGTGVALWTKSFENRLLKTMTRRMLEAYYETDYASVLKKGQGYFVNRVYGDLHEGLMPLLLLVQTSIGQGVLLVSSSFVLIYLSWRAFLILAAVIPISAGIGILIRERIRALMALEREQDGAVLAVLSKALSAFRMTKEFHLFWPTANVLDDRLREYFSTTYQRYKVSRLFQSLNDSAMVISDFASLFVGALFVLRGLLSFGAYLAFINTFWRTVNSLTMILGHTADYHSLGSIVERIAAFQPRSRATYFEIGSSVLLDNLTFSYSDRPVLRNLSLRISPGEKILIVGSNGSGKTTLANILSGYLAPSKGNVILPHNISSVTLPICFPPIKVKQLGVDDDLLLAFDLQHLAVLEAFADELSAGQQQKLAISLALSQNADLYIVDEPLACLDQESRKTALNVLFSRTVGKILILIMHLPPTEHQHRFDQIINVDVAGVAQSLQTQVS